MSFCFNVVESKNGREKCRDLGSLFGGVLANIAGDPVLIPCQTLQFSFPVKRKLKCMSVPCLVNYARSSLTYTQQHKIQWTFYDH